MEGDDWTNGMHRSFDGLIVIPLDIPQDLSNDRVYRHVPK